MFQPLPGRWIESAAEIGTAEILLAAVRSAAHDHGTKSANLQISGQRAGIKRSVHGIARPRVGELKIQQIARRKAIARSAESDSRHGETFQLLHHFISPTSKRTARGNSR